MKRHINHVPRPGPLYWDFRCLRCSQPVAEHLHWYERLWRWLTASTPKERSS